MTFKPYLKSYLIYILGYFIGTKIIYVAGLFLHHILVDNIGLFQAIIFFSSWLLTTLLAYDALTHSQSRIDQLIKLVIGCIMIFCLAQDLLAMALPGYARSTYVLDNYPQFFLIDILPQILYFILVLRMAGTPQSLRPLCFGALLLLFLQHFKQYGLGDYRYLEANLYPNLPFQVLLSVSAGFLCHTLSKETFTHQITILCVICFFYTLWIVLIFIGDVAYSSSTLFIEALRLFLPLVSSFILGLALSKKQTEPS